MTSKSYYSNLEIAQMMNLFESSSKLDMPENIVKLFKLVFSLSDRIEELEENLKGIDATEIDDKINGLVNDIDNKASDNEFKDLSDSVDSIAERLTESEQRLGKIEELHPGKVEE
jgi:hypothetical protein